MLKTWAESNPVPGPPHGAASWAPTPDGWQEAPAGGVLDDEDHDTIFVQRTPPVEWVLEINRAREGSGLRGRSTDEQV
ncbi:MAG TPA: hypothetical protein VK098_00085 [Beutenbergiaceae bacterium]|nr:hypothetical protein [Beutenbergiaceae bacterium]